MNNYENSRGNSNPKSEYRETEKTKIKLSDIVGYASILGFSSGILYFLYLILINITWDMPIIMLFIMLGSLVGIALASSLSQEGM